MHVFLNKIYHCRSWIHGGKQLLTFFSDKLVLKIMTHSKEVGSNRSEISSLDEGLYDSPLDPNLPVSARHDRSTRVSLLVEALVRSLVSVYETDRQVCKPRFFHHFFNLKVFYRKYYIHTKKYADGCFVWD